MKINLFSTNRFIVNQTNLWQCEHERPASEVLRVIGFFGHRCSGVGSWVLISDECETVLGNEQTEVGARSGPALVDDPMALAAVHSVLRL